MNVMITLLLLQFFLVVLLPFCSASTGSHVQVSIGGATYQHGAEVDLPEASPVYATPAPAPQVYHTPAPVYNTPAPVYHSPAPVYNTPVYHTEAPKYVRPAVTYTNPAPVYQTVQYQPAPKYNTQKQNCSVVDEVVKAKVCTPAFETKCSMTEVKVKVITDKEQCQDITRTVCTSSDEVVENKICVYSYEKQSESTVAKTVSVTYAKECKNQKVTVCQPAQSYGYNSYGQQYCKEEYQKTCYNVPKVEPKEEKVSVVYPSPVKSCSEKSITVPRVSCEDIVENKCITVPDVKDETEKVEKCEVALAEPSCQYVSLTLPKQVCVGLVYGHAVELTAEQYHAKVL